MGRQSSITDKTIYQISREKAGLSRMKAGNTMIFVTEDRIEKIEKRQAVPRGDEVLEMARAYHDPGLCNAHCATVCPIGQKYIVKVDSLDLASIAAEIGDAVDYLAGQRDRLVEIAVDEAHSDRSMDELIELGAKMYRLRKCADSLRLWMETEAK